MEYLYAVVGGTAAKLFDDLVADNPVIQEDLWKEVLKGVEWSMLAVLSIQDFNFTFILYTICCLHYSFDSEEGWSLPYEKALFLVYPIFLLLSYPTRQWFTVFDCILFFGGLCLILIDSIFLPKQEEGSIEKCLIRFSGTLVFLCILFVTHIDFFPISKSVVKLLWYAAAYVFCSFLFQSICVYNKECEKGVSSRQRPPQLPRQRPPQSPRKEEKEKKSSSEKWTISTQP